MEVNEKHLVAYSTVNKAVDHEGWLIRRGEANKAYKRWFVLKGNLLFYFERHGDRRPVGMIVLEGCTFELAEYDGQFSFKINFLGLGNRNYVLGAETHESMDLWMKALSKASFEHLNLLIMDLQKQLDDKLLRSQLGCPTGYELAGHVANVDRFGNLNGITPFEDIHTARTISVSLNDAGPYTRFESLNVFNEHTSPNELLKLLQYFTHPLKNNFGITIKQEFSWGNSREELNTFKNCLKLVCEMTIPVLKKEQRLLQIDAPAYVLGDIHGNFPDITVFEHVFWKMGPRLCPYSIVFLGDYVDRGSYSCEVVAYLFAHKVLNPNKFFLIRGNHEDRIVQKNFTFQKECMEKFKKEGQATWELINKVFDVMPLAGVIDKSIFVCHGGIPPPWICPAIEAINSIPCPLEHPGQESFLAWEMMWNDPIVQDQPIPDMVQNRQGFITNIRRGTGHCFSEPALDMFLNINGLSHLIRAHEVKAVGFQIQQKGKLLTVFSSSGYCGGLNEAACILLEGKRIRIIRVKTY